MLPDVFSMGHAIVRSDGIHFNGLCYSCSVAIKEQWFREANTTDEWIIPVYYDPNSAGFIFLVLDGTGIVPAYKLQPPRMLEPVKLDAYYKVFNYLKGRFRRRRKRRQRKQVENHV